jgi:hypothetical protein
MEIACDVLKKSFITNKIMNAKRKFRNINIIDIANTNNIDNFLKKINTPKIIEISTEFIKEYFANNNKDMGVSLLMAYYISSFSEKLFGSYKSRFEQKLNFAANKVVLYIEKIIANDTLSNDYNEEFMSSFDHYYSLYKIWKSKDSINEMSNMFQTLQELSDIIKIEIKKNGKTTKYNYLEKLLVKLFQYNIKYAIRMFLHNYNIFYGLSSLENKFWELVNQYYDDYKDELFIILVAELKIRLIPYLNNVNDRKELYYDLDTEDIINKIRNHNLNNKSIYKIINILQNKTQKINNTYDVHKIKSKITNQDLVNIFKSMFSETLNN